MRVIVAGGRDFNNLHHMLDVLDARVDWIDEVVCGGAKGADLVGEAWAVSNHIPVKRFDADWQRHGKSAGIIRNKEMGDYADALVAFWDGKSKGTSHMIDYANKIGLAVTVEHYKNAPRK